MSEIELSDEVRQNFHRFWDRYPFPVLLLHKSRMIMECNPLATSAGMVVGTRCIDYGEKKAHKGCLACQAMREQSGTRSVAFIPQYGRVLDSYWIPLSDDPDFFVHFGNDITEHASGQIVPESDDQEPRSACARCGI